MSSKKSIVWSAKQLSDALSLSIPGKSLKQLEDWCKKWASDDVSALTDTQRKDRYSFVQIVERTQKIMRSMTDEGDDDDDAEEAVEAQRKGTKRKVSRS